MPAAEAAYRLEVVGSLARQFAFVPRARRLEQLAAVEDLLLRLDAGTAYPTNFVLHAVTGYRRPTADAAAADGAELLAGGALMADLGLLVESVSDASDVTPDDAGEPVLFIDDLTTRLGITSKTLQRWRRKGLPARRWLLREGGRDGTRSVRRVGFRLSCVERFLAKQEGAPELAFGHAPLDASTVDGLRRHASRLVAAGHARSGVVRRVARRAGCSTLVVLHSVGDVLDAARPDPDPQTAARLADAVAAGRLADVARHAGLTRADVARCVLADRATRLADAPVRFHDDPLFDAPDAPRLLDDLVRSAPQTLDSSPKDSAGSMRDVRRSGLLASLCATPPPSAALERALFLRMNYHRRAFAMLRRSVDPELCTRRDLDALDRHLAAARRDRNTLICANQRLIVGIARRHLRRHLDLAELVSEGNLVLMRAVDGFDVGKGYKFSTYATLALMKGFAWLVGASSGSPAAYERARPDPRDPAASPGERLALADEIEHLLDALRPDERTAVRARFGLDAAAESTDPLADTALAKLRARRDTRRL